jgi:hypothetical protein
MLQAWNNEKLMVYTVDRQVFSLVPGKQFYTIGPGGDFDVPRPVRIEIASILWTASNPRPVEIPIAINTDEEWRATCVKNTPSTYPTDMWPNGNYPLNTLAFWPVPTQVNDLVLYTWGQAADFTSINQEVTFPPGYEEAFVLNLAVRLAPSYGLSPSPVTMNLAAAAKSRLEQINWDPTYLTVDRALLRNGGNALAIKSQGYLMDR